MSSLSADRNPLKADNPEKLFLALIDFDTPTCFEDYCSSSNAVVDILITRKRLQLDRQQPQQHMDRTV